MPVKASNKEVTTGEIEWEIKMNFTWKDKIMRQNYIKECIKT